MHLWSISRLFFSSNVSSSKTLPLSQREIQIPYYMLSKNYVFFFKMLIPVESLYLLVQLFQYWNNLTPRPSWSICSISRTYRTYASGGHGQSQNWTQHALRQLQIPVGESGGLIKWLLEPSLRQPFCSLGKNILLSCWTHRSDWKCSDWEAAWTETGFKTTTSTKK